MTIIVRVEGPKASGKSTLLQAMLEPLYNARLLTRTARNRDSGRLINENNVEAIEVHIPDLPTLQRFAGFRIDGKYAGANVFIDRRMLSRAHNPAQMIGAQVIHVLKDFDFAQKFDTFDINVKVADHL